MRTRTRTILWVCSWCACDELTCSALSQALLAWCRGQELSQCDRKKNSAFWSLEIHIMAVYGRLWQYMAVSCSITMKKHEKTTGLRHHFLIFFARPWRPGIMSMFDLTWKPGTKDSLATRVVVKPPRYGCRIGSVPNSDHVLPPSPL